MSSSPYVLKYRLGLLSLAAAVALTPVAAAHAQQPGASARFASAPARPAPADPAPARPGATASANPVRIGATGADPQYTLGPGDVVAIDVWHETEISRSLPVGPDGRISLPLAGQMKVQGLTTDQLAALITTRLRKYIDHPAVTVMLQDAQSRRFNILGMVNHPGSFPLNQPTTVLDAIAEAGGLRDFAHPKKIYVIRKRKSDGVEIRFNFNYDDVSRGLHMRENILLQPNDTVVAP